MEIKDTIILFRYRNYTKVFTDIRVNTEDLASLLDAIASEMRLSDPPRSDGFFTGGKRTWSETRAGTPRENLSGERPPITAAHTGVANQTRCPIRYSGAKPTRKTSALKSLRRSWHSPARG